MSLNRNVLTLLIIVSILTFSSCIRKDKEVLYIDNKSDLTLFALSSFNYPDTINYNILCKNPDVTRYQIPPNGTGEFGLFGTTWEVYLEKIESKTLMIFLYKFKDVKNLYDSTNGGCQQLRGKELKRIDVTIDYLNQNNYTITYP